MLEQKTEKSENTAANGHHTQHENWGHHEHVADLTHAQAQQLIESTGSVELAKHAVDVVADEVAEKAKEVLVEAAKSSEVESPPEAQSTLARSLGFSSYLDLFESSKPAGRVADRNWLVTAEASGNWAIWNDVDYQVAGRFKSQRAAMRAAGSSPKGRRKPR